MLVDHLQKTKKEYKNLKKQEICDIFINANKFIKTSNAFQKFFDESGRKRNKIWLDTGSEFYNRSIKSWLKKNSIEMYLTHNK